VSGSAPRRWWRRNGVALGLIVLLVPGTVFAMVGPELIDDAQRDPTPALTAVGHPVTAFGRSWELTASKEFVGTGTGADGNGIPVGSSLVGMLVKETRVAGAAAPAHPLCSVTLQTADPAGGDLPRSWELLDDPGTYRYGPLDTTTHYCTFDVGSKPTLEFVFLVPTGTAAHAELEVAMSGGRTSDPDTERLRFALR
jgi:hypothetical protein